MALHKHFEPNPVYADSQDKLPWDGPLHEAVCRHLRHWFRGDEDSQSVALCVAWYKHTLAKRQIPANVLAHWAARDVRYGRDLPTLYESPGGQKDAMAKGCAGALEDHLLEALRLKSRECNPAYQAELRELWDLAAESCDGETWQVLEKLAYGEQGTKACKAVGMSRRNFYLRLRELRVKLWKVVKP